MLHLVSRDEKMKLAKSRSNPLPEIETRIKKYNVVTKILDEVDIEQFKLCLAKPRLEKYFKNPVILGRGYFGTVRKVTLVADPSIDIVVKEALVENEDIGAVIHLKDGWQTNKNQNVINEAKLLLLVNNIVFDHQAPFFLLTYNVAFCDSCEHPNIRHRLNQQDSINRGSVEYFPSTFCSNIFMEQATDSFMHYTDGLKNTSVQIVSEIMTSIIYQLLIGLHILQWRFHIYHRDLFAKNLLILNVPRNGGYFEYVIGNDVYYVKNIGVLVCISDFGFSQSLHPSHCDSDGYLGQRNVEIVDGKMIPLVDSKNDGSQIIWDPFDKYGKFSSGKPGTRNNVFLDGSYKFNRLVDWTDSLRFPSEQFYIDIQSIFKLISDELTKIKIFPPRLTKTCEILGSLQQSRSILRNLNRGCILLRSDLMLKHLYIPPKLDKIPVIQEYRIR